MKVMMEGPESNLNIIRTRFRNFGVTFTDVAEDKVGPAAEQASTDSESDDGDEDNQSGVMSMGPDGGDEPADSESSESTAAPKTGKKGNKKK